MDPLSPAAIDASAVDRDLDPLSSSFPFLTPHRSTCLAGHPSAGPPGYDPGAAFLHLLGAIQL